MQKKSVRKKDLQKRREVSGRKRGGDHLKFLSLYEPKERGRGERFGEGEIHRGTLKKKLLKDLISKKKLGGGISREKREGVPG